MRKSSDVLVFVLPIATFAIAAAVHFAIYVPRTELGPCHFEYSEISYLTVVGCLALSALVGLVAFKILRDRGRHRAAVAVLSIALLGGFVGSITGHYRVTDRAFSCHEPVLDVQF